MKHKKLRWLTALALIAALALPCALAMPIDPSFGIGTGAAAAACAAEVVEVPEEILCFTESGGGQRREAAGEQCAALHEQ